jgi:hypothetical protein
MGGWLRVKSARIRSASRSGATSAAACSSVACSHPKALALAEADDQKRTMIAEGWLVRPPMPD